MLAGTAALLLQLHAVPASQDAKAALKDARAAQQRFEAQRRMRLPVEWHGGSGGRCDARIGRYCYWYDSTESKRVPEPPSIGEARDRLLAALDSAARRSPADRWIVGQRVRYLLEAGKLSDATAVAGGCAADRWWCAALRGLALHVAERYVASDSAFSEALTRMAPAMRCEWIDARTLLDQPMRREMERASCDERARLADRLYLLAQPLWSSTGNDFRTEIFARHTMAALLDGSANAQGMAWGDDSRELLLRYGWSEWFTRQEPSAMYYAPAVITGHDREPSYNLVPEMRSLRSWPRLSARSWRLRGSLATTRYSPRSLTALVDLPHQLARFPRRDSMLVVAAFAIADTGLQHDSTTVALSALSSDSLLHSPVAGESTSLLLPNDTTIVSLEVLGRKSHRAARARYTVDPLTSIDGATLSDLLLFAPRAGAGETLATALATALRDTRIAAREPLGVYWEARGMGREPLWLSLTVEPIHVGVVRRLATRLRLAPEPAPVRLRWQAVMDSSGHVTLRLPDSARGAYRIVLTAQRARGTSMALRSSREIQIVR